MHHHQRSAGLLDGLSERLASSSSSRPGIKRNALIADLDPPSAKRQQLDSSTKLSDLTRKFAISETELGKTKSQLREANAKIESLERDRRWFCDREQEEVRARQRDRVEAEQEIDNLHSSLSSVRREMAAFQQDYEDLKDQMSNLRLSSSNTIAQQQSALDHVRRAPRFSDISDAPTDENATQTMEFTMPSFSSSTNQRPDSPLPNDSSFTFTEEESTLLASQLTKTNLYLQELETTNAQLQAELLILRKRKDSAVVLEEQKRQLQQRLAKMEQYRDKFIALQTALDTEKQRSKASSSASSPQQSKLASELTKLRSEHLLLLDSTGELKAALSRTKQELAYFQEQLEGVTNAKDGALVRLHELEDEILQLVASRDREKREADYLKGVVASYQAEAQVSSSAPSSQEEERLRQYSAELESLLEEYKAENAKLQTRGAQPSLSSSTNSPYRPGTLERHLAKLQDERDEFEKANTQLLTKIDNLEQRIHEIYGDIAVGSHIPPNTRVLQLQDNPAQKWFDSREELVCGLKKEGEALRQRVKELEEVAGSTSNQAPENTPKNDGGGLIPRESWEMLNREKLKLEDEIIAKDKRSLRLKEVFSVKGEEFRQAVASILGVKLTFHSSGQIRVTSIYDLNTSFVFRPFKSTGIGGDDNPGGASRMELTAMNETPNEELPQLMRNWIEERQCPPGFMASVTLEAWDRWNELNAGSA